MEYKNKCEKILIWAKRVPHFDKKFIESVLKFYDKAERITVAQECAIDNIIEQWKIKIDDDSDNEFEFDVDDFDRDYH